MIKTINLNNTKFTISAGFLPQVPKDEKPHIVFAGRSNAGKSTLINKLVHQNKLARTSSAPGKTMTINFYETDKTFYLVDLPGYGYAKRAETERKRWSGLVEGYFKKYADKNMALVVLLVDLKVGVTADDADMLGYMDNFAIPHIIVAAKADKLNKSQKQQNLDELKNAYPSREIIPFSALSGEGADEIRESILKFVNL
ncbi:MAG: ribosome biogenesis GTP-binding protein YihA/YsxC [Oscillospiraceae bacterium]|nr:ribosome biogenesis GTP-binding protein YihA/YsxC [Oscillospiraceae bacterium]